MKSMSLDEAQQAITKVLAAMEEQFTKDATAPRLEQLRHHILTASMAIEHLFDEQERADHARAERIRAAVTED